MPKSLKEKVEAGRQYFIDHPWHLRPKMWERFKREVLVPNQRELMSQLGKEDKRFVKGILTDMGGFLTKVGE